MLRIRTLIEARRGAQAALARETGINEPALSRILNGKEVPYPKRGQALADALGWDRPWEELFEDVGVVQR